MVKNTIKVYGRIKRFNNKKQIRNYDIRKIREFEEIVFNTDASGDYGFYKNSKHRFRFCSLFDENTTQADVFDVIAKPVVNSVLEGYNGTIFAYGQTGSGKTYSMTGASEYETRGIIPRTIQHVFEYLRNSTTILYSIYISYLEIYNEIGYDLLNPRHRAAYLEDLPRVTILEDAKGQTHLRNLGVISVASEREAMCLLFLGDTNRTIAETPMNMYSSRSHCIFTVHVAATMTEDGRVRRSKLHLVDLAGSERIQKTGISGTMLVDAKQINLSLHYLEQVIIALSDEKRAHVPYRNSLMTSVLKDSLGGNCLTAMLATLSVDPRNFEETVSTCKFAQRVALVSSEAHINEEEDPEVRIGHLKLEIENLRKELVLYKESSIHSFKLRCQEKKELSQEEINECEKQIAIFIKSSSDHFPFDEDVELINGDKSTNKPLADIIKQKDNEISILVHLLSKEKIKTKEAELKNITLLPEGCSEASTNSAPNLTEKQAFEIFIHNDNNKSELNKCASILQQKITQAKTVANRIKLCKNNIVSLKVKLRENINNDPEVSNKLMKQLQSQQDIYRENINELRSLKVETDHLSHGFQQEKLRTLNRFKDWWAKENHLSTKPQSPSIPSFLDNSNLFKHEPEISNIFTHKNVNKFNMDYQSQDTISLNSDQFIPQFSHKNKITDLCIDTFPSFYDGEPNYLQTIDDALPETNYSDHSMQCFNQSYQNPYQISSSSSTYVKPNLSEFHPIRINSNYSNHSPPSSSNRARNDPLEFNNNNFFPETVPKQFTPLPFAMNQYSEHQNNGQYQFGVPQKQLSFPDNYHHYSENSQSNFMDYDLPEKLSNTSKISRQFSDENNCYYTYYPVQNQSSVEQIETRCEDIRSNSSDKIKITELPKETQGNVEDKKSTDFLKSIPLTGDPEVDEEILAFYRAKHNIVSSNNK